MDAVHEILPKSPLLLLIPFLLIILSLPVVRNETENGRHKLEVYATIKRTNWKFMLR